jgi:hypothetical protein
MARRYIWRVIMMTVFFVRHRFEFSDSRRVGRRNTRVCVADSELSHDKGRVWRLILFDADFMLYQTHATPSAVRPG